MGSSWGLGSRVCTADREQGRGFARFAARASVRFLKSRPDEMSGPPPLRFLIIAISVAACTATVDGGSPAPSDDGRNEDIAGDHGTEAPAGPGSDCAAEPCDAGEAAPPAAQPDEGVDEAPEVEPVAEPGEPETAESEQNDSVATADFLGPVPSAIDAVLGEGDIDFFELQVSSAGRVTIETGPVEEGGDSVDTVIELFENEGIATSLGGDDDGADIPLFSRLTVELPATGAYLVKVTGYSETTTGPYALSTATTR